MSRMFHSAGDLVRVLDGPDRGHTGKIRRVRMLAADCGYYVEGGAGLYGPERVELIAARSGGNPCGAQCLDRQHDAFGRCDHCLGSCWCVPATRLSP